MPTALEPVVEGSVADESRRLLAQHRQAVYRRTDRLFAAVMVLQWCAGMVVAFAVSHQAHVSFPGKAHVHLWATVLIGTLISLAPIWLALRRPGALLTRYVISAAQVLISGLLIHLTGGRFETPYHVLGSLAFLALYRDWQVIALATVLVVGEQFLPWLFFPAWIYGVAAVNDWRWLEQAGWMVFADAFLMAACLTGVREMRSVARHSAELASARRAAESAARSAIELARRDNLTGLANRALFHERVEHCLEHARRRPDLKFAVLFVDLDRFKVVNDSLGHAVGDKLLMEVAGRLAACVRKTDSVGRNEANQAIARVGGDEFTVLLEHMNDPADAVRVAQRMRQELARPCTVDGHEIFPAASIGVAIGSPDQSADEMLRNADAAMYRAKSTGSRVAVFDRTMHDLAMARLRLESDLRRAVEREEFSLVYQPIVSLTNRELIGFEALIRWAPFGKPIPPSEFIPVAEDTGLILPIGAWVLQRACEQLAKWQRGHPQTTITMSVNLSPRQMSDPTLLPQLKKVLSQTGIRRGTLKLEITESVMMADPGAIRKLFAQIKSLGVALQMDDFGTGYSSLSSFHQFPIDGLKIDRSFVQNMSQRRDYAAVVHAIISLAHNLGVQVVAEGLETLDQVVLLQALECDFGQGFFFDQPLSAEAAEKLIAALAPLAKSA